jgi:hypothetical protein
MKTHGCSWGKNRTPEYMIWTQMRRRCRATNHPKYPRYGGRGIQICERWNSFENFLTDMGQRPYPEATLDRIDNDGHYSPDNCRWADKKTQVRNRGCNKLTYWSAFEIRRLYATGEWVQRELAEVFGCARETISGVVTGRRWV